MVSGAARAVRDDKRLDVSQLDKMTTLRGIVYRNVLEYATLLYTVLIGDQDHIRHFRI